MGLEDHVRRRVRKEIAGRSAYDVIPAAGRIKLDAMESPYVWPSALQTEWLSTLRQVELNRYPDPTAFELCEDLRRWSGLEGAIGAGPRTDIWHVPDQCRGARQPVCRCAIG